MALEEITQAVLEAARTEAEHILKAAQKAADEKREELVSIFKEIEVLKKLKQKQYQEYLKEMDKKEKSVLDDIMSFNISDTGNQSGV